VGKPTFARVRRRRLVRRSVQRRRWTAACVKRLTGFSVLEAVGPVPCSLRAQGGSPCAADASAISSLLRYYLLKPLRLHLHREGARPDHAEAACTTPEGRAAARPQSQDREERRPDVPTVHAVPSVGHEDRTEEVQRTPPADTADRRAQCEGHTAAQPRELPARTDRGRSRADHTEARPTPATRTFGVAVSTIARRGTRTGSTCTGGPSSAIPAGVRTGPMV
jgi:hypothetical protein